MSSPDKKSKSPLKTPKYHRTVFGNTSPNLVNQSTNSIFSGPKGILSPNFNIINSDWNSTLSSSSSSSSSIKKRSEFERRPSFSQRRTFGDIFNEKFTPKHENDSNNNNNKNKCTTTPLSGGSSRKIRRTNTNEQLDRFIPSRQTTSGKLSIEKTKSLPSFAMMPSDHIESQTSEIYQNTVAQACGLEVGQRILQFQPPPPPSTSSTATAGGAIESSSNTLRRVASHNSNHFNCKFKTRQMISTSAAQARMKKVPLCPEKVLDAPGLVDDFYLNLISWSGDNVLAIALNQSVYAWNANDGTVKLIAECDTIITSIKWSPDDYYLSIGLENGNVEIWDIETSTKLRTMDCGNVRISSQSWNDHLLTIGARNGIILNNDVRVSDHITNKFENHLGEVCGLEWRSDGLQLASGGNDNIVNIWDARESNPIFTKTAHNAAVKAIAWCPTQTNLLATGGGSACKKIHFWNSNTGARINSIETESQVSSLKWGFSSGIGKEIASTHGFPNNEISIYSYPSLQKTGVIIDAHESRILCSEVSPNGTVLATIAADENLKFWKLWDEMPQVKKEVFSSSSSGKDMGKVMTIR